MAYENIRLRKSNVIMVDGYFFCMDEDLDALIMKTDDGTYAFTYPLDTIINTPIISLEHDGYNFWSLEQYNDGVIVRRWYINNYVCKLRDEFQFHDGADKFQSAALAVEHYHVTFTSAETAGSASLSISDGSNMQSGYTVVLGPNRFGQIQEATVNSAGADFVNINGVTSYDFEAGDPISFYKTIWLFNNYYGTDGSVGALYKINAYTGSIVSKTADSAYKDIGAATFYTTPSSVFGSEAHSIAYVKGTNTIFLDPADLSNSHGAMTMDNVENDLATVIPIFDIAMYGTNVYRLQLKATYYGNTADFDDDTYNYQLSTLNSFITSISLRAEPAILPANGTNVASITAIVKDQFNLPISGKLVYFTDDDPDGQILSTPVTTDALGIAQTSYKAGVSAREVRVTATAQQG